MTDKATFVINGAERVVVSQLLRSQGVFFGQSVHANGTKLYSARMIPFKGSWIEFATDINNVMYAYIDRKKKLPVTTLLRAIGFENDKDILEIFDLAEDVNAKILPSEQGHFSAHPLPGGGYSVLYFSRSFAGRNHFGCQHAADAALHFVLVCNGWFCLRRRGPERQIHRRTQPGSLYRHRPTSLWMGSGNGSSLYVDLCTGR